MVFPSVPIEKATDVIDRVQRNRKIDFIDRCLMIGQFHLLNQTPAVHNSAFYAFQSPVPMLAVRVLVPQDELFMTLDEYSNEEKLYFVMGYTRCMRYWPGRKK